jgi:hypothetical protein
VAGFGAPLPPVPAEEIDVLPMISSGKKEPPMKHIGCMALMLSFAIAGAGAQQRSVAMTFSGTGGPSAIDLKRPNTSTAEENVAGSGTFGQFTFRNVSATTLGPQPSSTCSGLFFQRVAGAGILRFQDGSLLQVALTQGGDCIDLVHMVGHCTLTLKVTGGTGRFQNASGTLTYTETALPLLADASGQPVFFSESGEITGTISGIGMERN